MAEKPKHAVCFIDDDPAELRRFQECLGEYFVIGAGTTREAALEDLRSQGRGHPDLFVLDMYFPEAGANTDSELAELQAAWDEVVRAQTALQAVLAKLGQSSRGGQELAKRVHGPYVFFTRKATLEEGMRALQQGARTVIKKPDPTERERQGRSRAEAYDQALRNRAREIAAEITRAIRG